MKIMLCLLLVASTGSARADEPTRAELKACDGGKGQVCLDLGVRYVNGQGVEKDEAKALEFYAKACSFKNAKGCGFAGTILIGRARTGDHAPENFGKGRALRERACDLDDGMSCNDLGTSWSDGKDGTPQKDEARAKGYYEKACKLVDGLGCFNLGNVYRLGEGVKADPKLAATHFKKACDLDTAKGCTELAIMYYEGKDLPKDVARAIELLDKACKLGSEPACKNLKILRPAETP